MKTKRRIRDSVDDFEPTHASTTEGLPIAPSMGPALEIAATPRRAAGVDRRVVFISSLAVLVAVAAALVAQVLTPPPRPSASPPSVRRPDRHHHPQRSPGRPPGAHRRRAEGRAQPRRPMTDERDHG